MARAAAGAPARRRFPAAVVFVFAVAPALALAFPALERLDLSACASLDDASLAAAVAGADLGGVHRVCLARASGVGWRGLDALVAACPRMEAVDLSHCVGTGDREAAALAAAAGLRELNLDKCLGVTDMGLAKVAVGCPKLEKLSFKWCREISDIGVDLLVNKCRELRNLDISYLKSIDVSRCDHVTSQGLASLIDGQSLLQKINAADSLHKCHVKNKDIRKPLDGIHISDKGALHFLGSWQQF